MITAEYIISEMGLNNNCTFTPTPGQMVELRLLVACPTVQALSPDELDTFLDGEHDDQLAIARRSITLTALHVLLNEIFDEA